MPFTIEIGGTEGSPDREIGPDEIQEINPAHPHTALGDWEAQIPFDQNIKQHEFKAARIYEDGTLIFRGYYVDTDWDERHGLTTITGAGLGLDLTNFGDSITYSNIAVWEAIQDFWNNYTAFNYNVVQPNVTQRVSDKVLVNPPSSDAWTDVVSPAASDPVGITDVDGDGDNELAALQSCFHIEGERFGNAGDGSESSASEGGFEYISADFADTISVNVPYTIPSDSVGVACRIRNPNDPDGDGKYEGYGFDINVDGEMALGFADSFSLTDSSYTWFTDDNALSNSVSGSTNIQVDGNASGGETTHLDLVILYDSRFTYNFDNAVDSNSYLAGPEYYPDAFTFPFIQQDTVWNVIGIGIVSNWNDFSNNQAIATSPDGGTTWTSHANTESTDDSYSNNASTTVDVRATFSRFGTGNTETPTSGHKRQYIQSWETNYDGDDLAVIDQSTFTGTGFDIAKRLHEKGNFRFVIDYANRDANDNLQKYVESFKTGEVQKTADFSVINRNPQRKNTQDYANHVTIRGALQNDGTRPTVTVQDDQEVADVGKQHFDAIRPELDTLEDVKSEARSTLVAKAGRSIGGNLEIHPKLVLPGYAYPVDWFDDGTDEYSNLKRVEYDQAYQQARGQLVFTEGQDITATVVDQGYKLGTVTSEV